MLLHIWVSDKMDKKTFREIQRLFTLNLKGVGDYNEYYTFIRYKFEDIYLNDEERAILKNIVETNFNANLDLIKEYVRYLSLYLDRKPLPKISFPELIYDYSQKMSMITNREITPIDVIKRNTKVKDVIKSLSKIEYSQYSKPLFKFLDETKSNIIETNEIKNYLISKIPAYAQYKSALLSKFI